MNIRDSCGAWIALEEWLSAAPERLVQVEFENSLTFCGFVCRLRGPHHACAGHGETATIAVANAIQAWERHRFV